MGGVLGDVGGGAAVFTAQRQALDQAHQHQDDRRGDADGRIGRQQTDHEGRQAHQQHGDEEGVLTSPKVAQAPEDDGAERPDRKARGKGHQGEDIAGGLVHAREELGGDDRGQRAVEIEVVPFDDGADGRRQNHEPVVLVDRVLRALRRTHGAVGHGQSLPLGSRGATVSSRSCCRIVEDETDSRATDLQRATLVERRRLSSFAGGNIGLDGVSVLS
ncbi:hypothetical protein D3C75_932370 [compost metagenome]